MKLKLPRVDFQVVLLTILTAAFLIISMALFQREHSPWIIVHNPASNIATMVHGTQDERAVRDLMLGGFREAVAIGTGSHPYGMHFGQETVSKGILEQMFAPDAANYIQQTREKIGLPAYSPPTLTFNEKLEEVRVKPMNGGIYFSSHFTQTIVLGENTKRTRTFYVQGFGHLAPATVDNPYQVKFATLNIKEINIKKAR